MVRNAVAQTYMLFQEQSLRDMLAFDSGVLELSLDETEMEVELKGSGTKVGQGGELRAPQCKQISRQQALGIDR